MRISEQAKYNSIYFLLTSFLLRWGFNLVYILYRGFSPMEYAILHMVAAVISLGLGYLAISLFRKSTPSGSNLGCTYLILLILNFIFAIGSVFAALVHLFGVNGGELESIWLM